MAIQVIQIIASLGNLFTIWCLGHIFKDSDYAIRFYSENRFVKSAVTINLFGRLKCVDVL